VIKYRALVYLNSYVTNLYFICREANEAALKEIEAKREDAATNAGDMEVHFSTSSSYALVELTIFQMLRSWTVCLLKQDIWQRLVIGLSP